MYIAEHSINGRRNYFIRASQYDPDAECWRSRDLYDLGRSPWEYIIYSGGNSFYIDECVSEKLDTLGIEHDYCELEELFWKFISRDIRQKLEPFHCRGLRARRQKVTAQSGEEQQVQIFDKRRINYLRTGVVDQRRVKTLPLKYFKALFNKSRDEIEQYVMQLEKSLSPREYKQYVYVSFDLQRHFPGSSLRSVPQALDQEELDREFINDLCRLHHDKSFWAGFPQRNKLHEYLVRYAVMFIDYEFDGGSSWEEYLQDFINSKRFHRPTSKVTVSMSVIVEIFGVAEDELQKLDRDDLTKLYRQKAHEHHPDKGGEHDEFVKLTEAYEELLKKKA